MDTPAFGPSTESSKRKASTRERATFFGTAYHKISGRNQVAIPRHLMREVEDGKEGLLLLLRWNNEGFLRLYTQKQMDLVAEQIRARADLEDEVKSQLIGHLATSAVPVEPDSQGRFVLPAGWVEDLGLKEEVAFCGALTRIEIWPAAARHDFESKEKERIAASAPHVTAILNI